MRARAHARRAARDPVGIGLQVFDQFLQRLGGNLERRADQHRVLRQPRDRHEVGEKVVGQVLVDRAVGDIGADVTELQGVAVGRRPHGLADGDRARGAGRVVDDELLAQFLAHALAHDARHHVGGATGGERHDDGDRLARKSLGERRGGDGGRHRRQYCSSTQHCLLSSHYAFIVTSTVRLATCWPSCTAIDSTSASSTALSWCWIFIASSTTTV